MRHGNVGVGVLALAATERVQQHDGVVHRHRQLQDGAAYLLMKEISPIRRFVPMFITMATPITVRKMTGSNHECDVSDRITMMMSTASTMM